MDLNKIKGSGPGNRIILEDVLAARPEKEKIYKQMGVPLDKIAEYEDIPNTTVRNFVAERLTFSKQNIPHFYVTIQSEVDRLIKLRAKLNTVSSTKISVNDMIIKAASLAAVKVPEVNSSWMGSFIRRYKNVDMSVAVQTEYGLFAPVVTATNLKGLEEISKNVKELADKAKKNKLLPTELSGGTFTVSNLGMFGVHSFSAIINSPQACILAVSSAEKKVIIDELAPKDSANPYK